jgi:hypothetical protein
MTLGAALTAVGCTLRVGRWYPPAGAVPSERYRVIVTLAAGRELTRQQMIDILLATGPEPSPGVGASANAGHPLL